MVNRAAIFALQPYNCLRLHRERCLDRRPDAPAALALSDAALVRDFARYFCGRKYASTFIPTRSGPGSSRSIRTSFTLKSVRWPDWAN